METKGVSICSDRCADAQRMSIINFMRVAESGSMFLNSVNVEDEKRNMYYIADKLEDCIKKVGSQNVIQIIRLCM